MKKVIQDVHLFADGQALGGERTPRRMSVRRQTFPTTCVTTTAGGVPQSHMCPSLEFRVLFGHVSKKRDAMLFSMEYSLLPPFVILVPTKRKGSSGKFSLLFLGGGRKETANKLEL